MLVSIIHDRTATSDRGPRAAWARERWLGGRIPRFKWFYERGRTGFSRVDRAGWLWPPRMNGKPELGQSGGCEFARLAASLVRARVSSAWACVAKTWFAARLREAGYVRGRCVADLFYSGHSYAATAISGLGQCRSRRRRKTRALLLGTRRRGLAFAGRRPNPSRQKDAQNRCSRSQRATRAL